MTFHTESEIARFTDEGVEIRQVVSRVTSLLPQAATVVAACGGTANDAIYRELRKALPALRILRIGDALAPRLIEQAIYEGHIAGRKV